jgi:hypothetical protein
VKVNALLSSKVRLRFAPVEGFAAMMCMALCLGGCVSGFLGNGSARGQGVRRW